MWGPDRASASSGRLPPADEGATVTTSNSRHSEREPVTVRGATPTDAPDVWRLLAALGSPVEVAAVRERIASFDTSARDHVVLAELKGQVAGVLALGLTPRFAEPGMFSRITALAVDPSVQRVGIGRRLVTEAERIAAANGSTLMQVNSGRRPERAAAHAFYVSLGYADQHDHHVLYEKVLAGR
jgi:GNAT superfamily N-acetyltransferase